MAKGDPDYLKARRLLNRIRHIRDEARGILDAVVSRKYVLNNITSAVTTGTERTIL